MRDSGKENQEPPDAAAIENGPARKGAGPRAPGPSDRALLWGLLTFNAVFRLLLLRVNGGEYTDGILQITQFERGDSFWPPLYTALAWVPRQMGIEGIVAGRLISWAASVALIVPLWRIARQWGGRRAAFFALVLYTASPMALRWSSRVMTDMLFVCLFTFACERFLTFWRDRESVSNSNNLAALAGNNETGSRLSAGIVGFTLFSVLATLTRYQGLMLAPLVALTIAKFMKGRSSGAGMKREGILAVWSVQLVWLSLPAWLLFQRFGHVQQVLDRTSQFGLAQTLLNYWNVFEMFLYMTPYLLTLPVFAFFMTGLIAGPSNKKNGEPREGERSGPQRRPPVRWLFLYAALAVLTAQSVFQSFQSRYLLPLLPLALVCAGAGMARAEKKLTDMGPRGRSAFTVLAGTAVVWSMGFGLTSVMLQRGAFADIFAAGKYIRQAENLTESRRIYTTESYGGKEGMYGINLSYAAGRKTKADPIPEAPYWFRWKQLFGVGSPQLPPDLPAMAPGSILAVDSRSCRRYSWYGEFIQYLETRYELKPMRQEPFSSTLTPLYPDIMGQALAQGKGLGLVGLEQNPLAWVLRYQKQHFETRLFVVGKRK